MTREHFLKVLQDNGIDSNIVHFDDSSSDGYCLRKNHNRWEIFVRERGKEYDLVGFPSESNALESLLKELLSIYSKKGE